MAGSSKGPSLLEVPRSPRTYGIALCVTQSLVVDMTDVASRRPARDGLWASGHLALLPGPLGRYDGP